MKKLLLLLICGAALCQDPAKPDMLTPSILEVLEKDIIDNPIDPVVVKRKSTTPPPSPRDIKDASKGKSDLSKVAVRRGCAVV